MKAKISQWIISNLEKRVNPRIKNRTAIDLFWSHGLMLSFPFIGIFLLSYTSEGYFFLYDNTFALFTVFFGPLLWVLLNKISINQETIYNSNAFIYGFFLSLHKIYFYEKEFRNEHLEEYLKTNFNIHKPRKMSVDNIEAKVIPRYSELEVWVESNVSTSKAIKKVFYHNTKSHQGHYDISLILWYYFLPMGRLDDNEKLELIKLCRFTENTFLESTVNITVKNIDYFFERYSNRDIKRLFSSLYNGKDYYLNILNYVGYSSEQLPVHKHMDSLIYYMNTYVDLTKKGLPMKPYKLKEEYEDIIGDSPLGKVNFVYDFAMLSHIANLFSNCAKAYAKKCALKDCTFFYIEGKKPILFHLNRDGNIEEAKHKANKSLSIPNRLKLKKWVTENLKKDSNE